MEWSQLPLRCFQDYLGENVIKFLQKVWTPNIPTFLQSMKNPIVDELLLGSSYPFNYLLG